MGFIEVGRLAIAKARTYLVAAEQVEQDRGPILLQPDAAAASSPAPAAPAEPCHLPPDEENASGCFAFRRRRRAALSWGG